MSDGNAGREALPAGPERPSITSPAELAVHPGRELVGVGGGRQRVDGPALRGGPGLAGGARLGAEEHAERLRPGPVSAGSSGPARPAAHRGVRRRVRGGGGPARGRGPGRCQCDDGDAAARRGGGPQRLGRGRACGGGADVGASTAKGVTPLDAAARQDAVSVAGVLLDHEALTGAQDTEDDTPLHSGRLGRRRVGGGRPARPRSRHLSAGGRRGDPPPCRSAEEGGPGGVGVARPQSEHRRALGRRRDAVACGGRPAAGNARKR